MKPRFFIEYLKGSILFEDNDAPFTVCKVLGIDTIKATYVPFSNDYNMIETKQAKPTESDFIVPFGSIGFVQATYRKCPAQLPNLFDQNLLKCSSYYTKYGKYLLQKKYIFTPIGDLLRRREWIYNILSSDGSVFIRPDDNLKSFAAEVVHFDKLDDFYTNIVTYANFGEDLMCVVSSTVKIDAEFRTFISNGKLITGSLYREDGELSYSSGVPDYVVQKANEIASHYSPFSDYVMDLAITDNGVELLEIGSSLCCGYYDSDISIVFKSIYENALKECQNDQT